MAQAAEAGFATVRLCVLALTLLVSLVLSQTNAKPPADIIIVGAGISGLSAALEAAHRGAQVLVVEMSSVFGGHAVLSNGGLSIVGTPFQESQNVKDTPEIAYKDFLAWGKDADPAWVRYYVENSRREIYDWLTGMGVAFYIVSRPDGNSVARFHWTQGKGLALIAPMYRECLKNPNIRFEWNTKATGLQVERGRVTGVQAQNARTGERRALRARAVILATGGFQSNLEMVRKFWPKNFAFPPRLLAGGAHSAVGFGHELARQAGGILYNMDHQWNYALGLPDPRDPTGRRGMPTFNPNGIWVNAHGKRFVNEFAGPNTTMPALLAQPGATYWSVFDEAGKKSLGVSLAGWDSQQVQKLIYDHPGLVKSAATLPELAAKVAMPAEALMETVERWNQAVDAMKDEFGRLSASTTPPPQKIQKPPFYAIQLFPITRKSMGGVKIDLSCRLVTQQGTPIPGLYAAGELTGFAGINGKAGLEGTFLGPSIVTGRVAGRAVVADLKISEPAPQQPAIGPPTKASTAAANENCASCHDLPADLARRRSGYFHYEKSHAIVLERRYACSQCHAELAPYRRESHRIDKFAQIENCTACHGAR